MAALIAERFKIDPILVLKSSYRDWAIRIAAYRYAQEQEAKAEARNRAQANSKRRVY